jgi:hypothetical protein
MARGTARTAGFAAPSYLDLFTQKAEAAAQ